jgi:hypothetical protein
MTETEFHAAMLRGSIAKFDQIIERERKQRWWAVRFGILTSSTLAIDVWWGLLACALWVVAVLIHGRIIRDYERYRDSDRKALRGL